MAAPSTGVIPNPNAAEFAAAVTPSDTSNFGAATRALYVGTGGNVVVVMATDDAAITFANVPSGSVLPVRAKRVNSTSTTASGIVALW